MVFDLLANSLWTGDWIDPQSGGSMKSPLAAKQRLERLLSKTTEVRQKYQTILADQHQIRDKDFSRSLDVTETTLVHNAWMNDVADWMHAGCLAQYEHLRTQDSKGKSWGSAARPADGKGKGGSSAAKPADRKGKGGGSAATPAGLSPWQQAQQLKKQRFNKVISDLAANKGFFMNFLRHPRMRTLDGLHVLLESLQEIKMTGAYQDLKRQSEKRTEQATQLQRKRDHARFELRKGKRHAAADHDTELAAEFKSGALAQ